MSRDTDAKLQRLKDLDDTAINVIAEALNGELSIKPVDLVAVAERHLDRTGVSLAKPSIALLLPNIPVESLVGALSTMFGVVGLTNEEALQLNDAISHEGKEEENQVRAIQPARQSETIEGEFAPISDADDADAHAYADDFTITATEVQKAKKPIPYDPKDKKNAPAKTAANPFITDDGEYKIPEGFGEQAPAKKRKAK